MVQLLHATRCPGCRHAYVAFLDADDAWLPAHCETLIALLQASPGAAAAFGRIRQLEPGVISRSPGAARS